jgi:hypothetical protein
MPCFRIGERCTGQLRTGDGTFANHLRGHAYDRSILHISLRGELYATLHACIWNAGKYPNRADYEIEFPVEADYELSVLYTAAEYSL